VHEIRVNNNLNLYNAMASTEFRRNDVFCGTKEKYKNSPHREGFYKRRLLYFEHQFVSFYQTYMC
jgi:hypothetical protein